MSECVVRMEMPKGCWGCPLGHYDWIWGDDGREKMVCFCCLDGVSEEDGHYLLETEEKRPSWCPIICQLPEWHGRLVDADAYSAEMKDRQDAAWKWRNEAIAEEDEVKLARAEGAFTAFAEAKLTWDEQVTIVPAEAESQSPKPTDPLPIRGVEYVQTEVDVQTGTVTYKLRERSET